MLEIKDLRVAIEGSEILRRVSLDVGPAEPRDEGGGVLQVGADPDLGDSDLGIGQLRITELVAQEDSAQRVADFLSDAQLALRGWLAGGAGHRRADCRAPPSPPSPSSGEGEEERLS